MTHAKAWRQFRAAMIVGDALVVVATYVLADFLRCKFWMNCPWPELIAGRVSSVRIQMKVLAFLPIAWPIILNTLGWYEQRWRSWQWVLRKAAGGSLVIGLLMAALALLFERELYPRAQIGLLVALLPATSALARGISALAGSAAGGFGSRMRPRILIVGSGRESVRLRRLLRSAAFARPEIVGHLRGPWETEPARVAEGIVLGTADRLGTILDDHVVDEVIFSAPLDQLSQVLPYVALCEEIGVTAQIQAESMACHSIPEMISLHGVPLLTYSPVRHAPELLSVKRSFDIVIAIIGIVATAPIMLVCAALIRATGPGPILFRQRRSGLNGRPFWMYKFRTMEPDAESRLADVAHLNQAQGPVFKATNDPRVTPIGAFLRRWSLDELPQLFNVLFGDMAIVGPRPPIPAEVEKYDRWQRRRLSMRPGLTCLWQIKGRHRIGFDEWMQLDLFYIDYWSLKLDFLIICKTVGTVLSGSGA